MTKITPELEKVARQIYSVMMDEDEAVWDDLSSADKAPAIGAARAALEAIREPSEGMRAIIERRFPCDTNISRILVDHILGKETGG
jgi:hypothetical protein